MLKKVLLAFAALLVPACSFASAGSKDFGQSSAQSVTVDGSKDFGQSVPVTQNSSKDFGDR